jgi:phage minor structural protein
MTSDDYGKVEIKGHVQDERGQYYVVNDRSRKRDGLKRLVQFDCMHVMFKLADFKFPYASYIEEGYGVNIVTLLDSISAATSGKFSFAVDDTFDLMDVKDFGQGNCLQALNFIIEKWACEIEPDNFVIHIKKQIGMDRGFQARIKKNIININFKDSSRALVTRMFAQMKDGLSFIGLPASNLTSEEYDLLNAVPGAIVDGIIKVNYLISPYAAFWSNTTNTYFDGEIIKNDIEDQLELLNETRKALHEQEVPAIEVPVDVADLYSIDNTEPQVYLGDTIKIFDPDLQVNGITARTIEIQEYPFDRSKQPSIQLANYFLRDYQDIIADLNQSKSIVDRIVSGGKVLTSVFENFAAQAIYDINNSKTELIYPLEGGILAQDKNNPLRQVRLTATGIGVSTDGWKTVDAAITADGILAPKVVGVLGQFAQLRANQIILGAGGEQISDSLLASATNWNGKTTLLTPDGVYTGTLHANQIIVGGGTIDDSLLTSAANWNGKTTLINSQGIYTGQVTTDQLIAGTAKITTALIESLVVGGNVTMGPSATISWGNVTSKPFIPQNAADVGALATNAPQLTYIGPTGIYTGTLTVNQILVGTLTGFTLIGSNIKTAASGSRLEINSSGFISYNSSNQLEGVNITSGNFSFLDFYYQGQYRGGLGQSGGVIQLTSSIGPIIIQAGSGQTTIFRSAIDFSQASSVFGLTTSATAGLESRLAALEADVLNLKNKAFILSYRSGGSVFFNSVNVAGVDSFVDAS